MLLPAIFAKFILNNGNSIMKFSVINNKWVEIIANIVTIKKETPFEYGIVNPF